MDAIKWTTLALDGTIIVECSRREEETPFLTYAGIYIYKVKVVGYARQIFRNGKKMAD